MIVIETCPRCGHDLEDIVICTYPPVPVKECPRCGWRYERTPEKVVRVPFNESKYITRMDTIDPASPSKMLFSVFNSDPCQCCNNDPRNGGSGFCNCMLGEKGKFICE